MVDWLSLNNTVGCVCANPSSSRILRNHRIAVVASVAAYISASHEDRATVFCLFDFDQNMPLPRPNEKQIPV